MRPKTNANKPGVAPESLRFTSRKFTREGLAVTTVLCAAGNFAIPTGADAEDAPAEADDSTVLPEYTVEGMVDTLYKPDVLSTPKYTQPLVDVPKTITIVPKEVMEEQNATTLRDVLRNVSGISIQAGEGGQPAGDNLSIRGFNARTDIFVDGIRDFGAYSRDSFNLEQVEVAKGPASSTFGRGVTGGAVNLVSKEAGLDPFVETVQSVGTDSYYRGTLDINEPIPGLDGAAFRLNTMYTSYDVPGRDEVSNERWGVAGSLAFGLGEHVVGEEVDPSGKTVVPVLGESKARLFLSFFYLEEDNQPDYGIPWVPSSVSDPRLTPYIDKPAPVPFDSYYGSVNRDYEETETIMGSLRFEYDISDSVMFRDQFRIGQTKRDSVISAPRFNGIGAGIRRDDWKDRDEENLFIVNQADLLLSFDTGPLAHDAIFGVEVAYEEYERHRREERFVPDTDLFNPTPFDPVSGSAYRTGAKSYSESLTTSLYLFDTVEITEWLEVTGGVRYDNFDLDFTSRDASGRSETLSRVDEMTSGRAAVVLKPTEDSSIYFGWGTSFNPSGEQLTLSSGGRGGATFEVDPEKSETFELGTKWNVFNDRLQLSAALFQTTKTNARTTDPADPTNTIVLDGEQRVRGFELGVAGSITDWWRIFGGYTYLDGEVTESRNPDEVGQRLSNTPEHSLGLWTVVDLPGGFFIGGGPQFVDSRFNNTSNVREAPSYWVWDAVVGYEVNENFTVQVNVHNIADEEYIDRVGGGHFIPGNGRSVVVSGTLRF